MLLPGAGLIGLDQHSSISLRFLTFRRQPIFVANTIVYALKCREILRKQWGIGEDLQWTHAATSANAARTFLDGAYLGRSTHKLNPRRIRGLCRFFFVFPMRYSIWGCCPGLPPAIAKNPRHGPSNRPLCKVFQADDADVAKLVDARDLKSLGLRLYGFDPRRPHHCPALTGSGFETVMQEHEHTAFTPPQS